MSENSLDAALADHGIDLPAGQVAMLARYCEVLWHWNARLNLTRHTDFETFVARDLVDSLAIEQFLKPDEHVLDVGSGGGVPGVVLCILRGDLAVELCESVAKRARALAAIVGDLGLDVPVHHARAETLLQEARFDTLVARAVATLPKLLGWLAPCRDSFGRLLVVKGPKWIEERQAARERRLLHKFDLRKLHAYPMRGSGGESVLLEIRPKK